MRYCVTIVLLSIAISVGCGPATTSVPATATPADAEIRSGLQYLAETGVVDSGIMSIEESIERMSDPAKSAELKADLEKLKAASGEAAVKKQAEAMLEKL